MTLPGERWLTSRFTGILQALDPIPLRAHDPRLPLWAATTAPRAGREPLVIGGAGWTADDARAACLGEALERWDSEPSPRDGAVQATAARWPLDEPFVPTDRWILFSPAQYAATGFPFAPFDDRALVRWLPFRALGTGEPTWAPEELASLHGRAGEPHRLASMSSTGLSAGSRAGAHPTVLRGLQEVVERDALVRAWWGEYPLEAVDEADVFRALGADRAARVRRPNLRYAFRRIDTPFSGAVALVTVQGDDAEGPCFSAGSACRETLAAALEKALVEAVQGRHYVRHRLGELGAARPPPDEPAVPVDFPSHALFYARFPARLPETVLARPPRRAARLDAPPEPLGALLERLGPARAPLVRVVTPAAAARVAPDLLVVRVVVPGLVPLHGDHRLAHLGADRWRDEPYARWLAHPPHPFA